MVYTKVFLKFPRKFWPCGPEKEFFIYAHERRGYYTFWQVNFKLVISSLLFRILYLHWVLLKPLNFFILYSFMLSKYLLFVYLLCYLIMLITPCIELIFIWLDMIFLNDDVYSPVSCCWLLKVIVMKVNHLVGA